MRNFCVFQGNRGERELRTTGSLLARNTQKFTPVLQARFPKPLDYVPSIASTRERIRAKHVLTRRQPSDFQVLHFEVFPPKCVDTAQREDVSNQ